ncbi:tripartite motif-containing protein 59-like [Scylla paramamosain]|uniref:tripartite motif-containing protein 59-like n=1 Tax=Scylla paramamosain TaxID=85552 RepID=UPI003083DE69
MAEALPEEARVSEVQRGVEEVEEHAEAPYEEALTCSVCLKQYDSEFRRPLMLPACGHTFCRSCVKGLACEGVGVVCPCCRREYKDTDVDSFPINFSVEILASSTKNQQKMKPVPVNECQEHGVRYAFWCRFCEVPACGECLFDGHPRPSHAICRITDVVKEIKSRAEELVEQSSEETVGFLGDLLNRVVRGISDLQEAGHILQEVGRLKRTAQDSKTLSSITKAFESAKGVRQRVQALRNCEEPHDSIRIGDRPVVVALSETGGLAKVKVEERGIHIYSLRSSSTAYTVAVKMSVLLGCVKKDHPLVFLDLRAGDRPLGRVYIELWGHMKRAQQFMALCLGTYGPSYRDTRFDGVSSRGEAGEYVRGGDYSGRQGLGGRH